MLQKTGIRLREEIVFCFKKRMFSFKFFCEFFENLLCNDNAETNLLYF